MFVRSIKLSKENSFFLFGARATGKSTLLKERLDPAKTLVIDLLKEEEFLRYATSVGALEQVIDALPPTIEWVVIDEIQKLPKLLDEVHRQIFAKRCQFALTGSSARKLRRGQANLLAGRAFTYNLFPLTYRELGAAFVLNDVLSWGTLPDVLRFTSGADKAQFLSAYTSAYVKEEVAAEQLVRGVLPFQRFLPIAGQSNGEILNFSKIARDIGIDSGTVKSYFSILEDTLLGFLLEAHDTSIRKRQRAAPKFYFFDTGISRFLMGLTGQALSPSTYGFGRAFEHFIILEIIRLTNYAERNWKFSYVRTAGGVEVDLVIERPGLPIALVEIKSAHMVDEKTINTLNVFQRLFTNADALILSQESTARRVGKVTVFPWKEGIAALGI